MIWEDVMKRIIVLMLSVGFVLALLLGLCSCGTRVVVNFDTDGGSEVEGQEVLSGKKAHQPQAPIKDGYAFIGWYLGEEEWSFAGHIVTEDITLKARWAKCLIFDENDDGTYTVSDYKPIAENITIPSTYKGKDVTAIGARAFVPGDNPEKHLLSITIPDTVTVIEASAFSGCDRLSSVKLPGELEKIEDSAFSGCISMTSINIPSSVEYIGENVFKNCDDIQLEESDGLYYLDNWLIRADSDIEDAQIKDGCVGIAGSAFEDCKRLESVQISSDVDVIGPRTFLRCKKLTRIEFFGQVSKIWDGAFAASGITEIELPVGIEEISTSLFSDCEELVSIVIPEGVTRIGENAFVNCSSLASVTLPNSLQEIGEEAFVCCRGLKEITIPGGVEKIEKKAFEYSGLTSLIIPKSVKEVGFYITFGCDDMVLIGCEAQEKPDGWDEDWTQFDSVFDSVIIAWGYGQGK